MRPWAETESAPRPQRQAGPKPTGARCFCALRRHGKPGGSSWDIERETNRQTIAWQNFVPRTTEDNLKVDVRAPLLERWLGERWVGRCIRVDGNDLSVSQVQQIVDSLLPDVPVQRGRQTSDDMTSYELLVVDRDAFALELAREWVRSGLPRSPVR